ncbi:MAG: bifunctional adenosylcobinamide kinase/adenosylcobinamide-phosphate guanylyltransferase [Hominilimicola sp.]
MFVLITGGSGSGKSEFAEKTAMELGGDMLYIATMQPQDAECVKRIERHRKMRAGKGFRTIECYGGLCEAAETADTMLLECVSNLTANLMFSPNGAEDTKDEIMRGIAHLLNRCDNLVVVTNEISSDGIEYDGDTEMYMRNIGAVNSEIAKLADAVYEVVYGSAVRLK